MPWMTIWKQVVTTLRILLRFRSSSVLRFERAEGAKLENAVGGEIEGLGGRFEEHWGVTMVLMDLVLVVAIVLKELVE